MTGQLMSAIALLLLAQTGLCASPWLVGVKAANLKAWKNNTLQRYSTGGASAEITGLAPAGGLFPGAMAYMPDRAAVALPGLSLKHGGTNLTIVGLNGSLINSWNYRELVVDNIAYDTSLMQLFISAYNQSAKHNAVYSVDASGNVKLIAVVPGVVQVAMSTYCSVGHMFFLLLSHNLTGNSILHVQTQQGIVSAPVIVTDDIEVVAGWNPNPETLYAWVGTNATGTELVSINITTGARINTFASYPTLSGNGGCATIDLATMTIYSSLLTPPNLGAHWVVTDLTTGASSASAPLQGFPINLALTGGSP